MAVQSLKVAVAILTYNRCDYLDRTLTSLFAHPGHYDLFIYDNGSTDETRESLLNCNPLSVFSGMQFNDTDVTRRASA